MEIYYVHFINQKKSPTYYYLFYLAFISGSQLGRVFSDGNFEICDWKKIL